MTDAAFILAKNKLICRENGVALASGNAKASTTRSPRPNESYDLAETQKWGAAYDAEMVRLAANEEPDLQRYRALANEARKVADKAVGRPPSAGFIIEGPVKKAASTTNASTLAPEVAAAVQRSLRTSHVERASPEERARITGILNSPEGLADVLVAECLAYDTDLSLDQSISALRAAAVDRANRNGISTEPTVSLDWDEAFGRKPTAQSAEPDPSGWDEIMSQQNAERNRRNGNRR